MQIIQCTAQDAHMLAVMNKRLIEDEKSRNPMTPEELETRMNGFLRSEYSAYFFKDHDVTVGYALVRHTDSPPYLRQFYIERVYRRRHYGREAFRKLMDFLQAETINVDVLPWNEAGLRFWKSLGFMETAISMEYRKNPEN